MCMKMLEEDGVKKCTSLNPFDPLKGDVGLLDCTVPRCSRSFDLLLLRLRERGGEREIGKP